MDAFTLNERRARNARYALGRLCAGNPDQGAVVRAVLVADDAFCRAEGFAVAGDALPASLVEAVQALQFLFGVDGARAAIDALLATPPAAVPVSRPLVSARS